MAATGAETAVEVMIVCAGEILDILERDAVMYKVVIGTGMFNVLLDFLPRMSLCEYIIP